MRRLLKKPIGYLGLLLTMDSLKLVPHGCWRDTWIRLANMAYPTLSKGATRGVV